MSHDLASVAYPRTIRLLNANGWLVACAANGADSLRVDVCLVSTYCGLLLSVSSSLTVVVVLIKIMTSIGAEIKLLVFSELKF